ncbi:MAG: PfkB family carbohydrate kinase [Bacteroidales bacterium]|jgi:rfaE bifunctional protein kinase chain/domain|nr:PfkB family carbohydrate kinase [Bacteroidales bacterium]
MIERFRDKNVLIIGDVMIDSYIVGQVNKISPEAPVPVLHAQKREDRLGGAGNVALNIKSLGANPILCSVVGDDANSKLLYQLLTNALIDTSAIIQEINRKTTLKCRMISKGMQLLRVDDEDTMPVEIATTDKLLKKIDNIIDNQTIDAIIFVDYDKGVISKPVIEEVVNKAQQKNIITAVDPKMRHFADYDNVTLFKPNLKEFTEGQNMVESCKDRELLQKKIRLFSASHHIENLMLTLSEEGIMLYHLKTDTFVAQPAFLRNISDVSGAGDSVISVAALCLASGFTPQESMQYANMAGGMVCEFAGVVPVTAEQLEQEAEKLEK